MDLNLTKMLQENSFLTDGNLGYIEEMYDAFLLDPQSVDEYWRAHFAELAKQPGFADKDKPLSQIREHFLKLAKLNGHGSQLESLPETLALQQKQVAVQQLINAYRAHGHHLAKLDPLDMQQRKKVADLDPAMHDLHPSDMEQHFPGAAIGSSGNCLADIYLALQKTYSGSIGVEFMHITDNEQTQWIQQRLEAVHSQPEFSKSQKQRIYQQTAAAETLEKYLGSKYVGQKRFSLEGGVSLIPMLDEMVQRLGTEQVKEVVIGMAHRGRLNVLVNTLGKSPEQLFSEFEGKNINEEFSGDVKYHMGFSSNIQTPGGPIHLALAFNPSHLEIINPVVEGSVRARQERRFDEDYNQVVPVLIHGDAALAGQGVVPETFNFSQARGFCTGGTIHVVVNNQIGFTTSNPLDSRSTLYCTDVAKMVQAPVLHVNGDDPEACVFAMQVAVDFRMRFKKDVMIDLVCYRKHGHNEADEPSGTQPLMYAKIKQHPRTREIYAKRLVNEGTLTESQTTDVLEQCRQALDAGHPLVDLIPEEKAKITDILRWKSYLNQDWNAAVDTRVSLDQLRHLAERVTTVPDDFKLQAQVKREYDSRQKMAKDELPVNWGFAETLAYASLLVEDYKVRLCGQDSGRGTFSHRHGVLHHNADGSIYVPLQHIAPEQGEMDIIDSVLSEEAVLAFEYGYATTTPSALVIWEAQFGDFANGAQVVIDQFISSGEQKWGRLCGLAMYLPHGYEGQGPEHSSARLERYLQLCAQNNIQVCVPSSPQQMFHMLRRQMLRPYRKPLIVFTPKSLLRHKLATCTMADLAQGQFELVIPEVDDLPAKKVRKVVMCSGKVYYDLLQHRRDQQQNDVAIIRIEQLYPFPEQKLREVLDLYPKAKDVVWCQEEPLNQGAWYSLYHHFVACVGNKQSLSYAGREASASPATGYTSLHLAQQKQLVEAALK